jgi:hypothetical protein
MEATLRKRMSVNHTFRGIGATAEVEKQIQAMEDKRKGLRVTKGIGFRTRSEPPNKQPNDRRETTLHPVQEDEPMETPRAAPKASPPPIPQDAPYVSEREGAAAGSTPIAEPSRKIARVDLPAGSLTTPVGSYVSGPTPAESVASAHPVVLTAPRPNRMPMRGSVGSAPPPVERRHQIETFRAADNRRAVRDRPRAGSRDPPRPPPWRTLTSNADWCESCATCGSYFYVSTMKKMVCGTWCCSNQVHGHGACVHLHKNTCDDCNPRRYRTVDFRY